MAMKFWEYTKISWIVHFKRVDFFVCGLYFNKKKIPWNSPVYLSVSHPGTKLNSHFLSHWSAPPFIEILEPKIWDSSFLSSIPEFNQRVLLILLLYLLYLFSPQMLSHFRPISFDSFLTHSHSFTWQIFIKFLSYDRLFKEHVTHDWKNVQRSALEKPTF